MSKKDTALEYLRGDDVLNIDMISAIIRGCADIIYAGSDGVFLRESGSGAYMLSITDEQKGLGFLQNTDNSGGFCVRMRSHFDFLRQKYPELEQMECYQAAYRGGKIELPHEPEIKPLDDSYADFAGTVYGGGSAEYIRSRIAAGEMFGGFVGGELVGFIGKHDEGNIGLLEVLPAFQRRGYAQVLSGFMINRELDCGRIAFSQVKTSNLASIALHKKMGMELSKGLVFMLF